MRESILAQIELLESRIARNDEQIKCNEARIEELKAIIRDIESLIGQQ